VLLIDIFRQEDICETEREEDIFVLGLENWTRDPIHVYIANFTLLVRHVTTHEQSVSLNKTDIFDEIALFISFPARVKFSTHKFDINASGG
jgi:hypothetical protein